MIEEKVAVMTNQNIHGLKGNRCKPYNRVIIESADLDIGAGLNKCFEAAIFWGTAVNLSNIQAFDAAKESSGFSTVQHKSRNGTINSENPTLKL